MRVVRDVTDPLGDTFVRSRAEPIDATTGHHPTEFPFLMCGQARRVRVLPVDCHEGPGVGTAGRASDRASARGWN